VRGMEFQRPDGRTDLVSVGLVAFFATLIVVVAALLVLPAVF
jgi:hypothetical protein